MAGQYFRIFALRLISLVIRQPVVPARPMLLDNMNILLGHNDALLENVAHLRVPLRYSCLTLIDDT